MTWYAQVAQGLLPVDKRNDRLSQLLVYLCLAVTLAAIAAATMNWLYGYQSLALLIYLAAATFPVALLVLHYANSPLAAGHYLAGNIMLQSVFLAAEPAIGCVVLIGLAAGAALLGKFGSRIWIGLIVARCLYVAVTAPTEVASATAAVATLCSFLVFLIVQLSELSRIRMAKRAESREQLNTQQTSVIGRIVSQYFDVVMQVSDEDIFQVSRSVEKLLGYTPDKFIDRPLSYYLHPDDPGLVEELTPDKPPLRRELRMRHADGRWVWVEMYATPGLFGGNPNRMHVVLRDYEKERKVSDQLTQAQRLESMGSMAAAVAHDFNNMLTVIIGIADELPNDESRSEIRRVAGNAAALTHKLLTFGHGQRTSSEIHDLSHLMHEQSLLLQHTLDSRYIIIESYVEDPLLVRIEESQFEQILVNLVNNAREAMPEGGELEVSLQAIELRDEVSPDKDGHYALLEVGDSGRGMDADTQAKIFDPFFSTKEAQTNNGLGLSSCYGIVSQHGGFIEVDSTIGAGTAVRVYLPIAETRDHEPTLELIDNEVSIMVIDDDPGVVRVVRNALVRTGYHVRGFTDVVAAREFFNPGKVSMVIADVVMPDISGANLIRDLREQAPELPVLFISGFANQELDEWHADEITGYLAKPFRGEEVVARVNALLSATHTSDEAFV